MKIIEFNDEIQFDANTICQKNKKYIISDGFLQQIKDSFSSYSIKEIYPFVGNIHKKYAGQDLTNKTVLIWRTGGMGDLCFITPNLKYIKKTFKDSKIIFGCGSRFRFGMMDHPYIDKLVSIPIDYDLYEKADYYLMFEGIIENNPDAHEINAYELFRHAFGFTQKIPDNELIPILGISEIHRKKHVALLEKFYTSLGKNYDHQLKFQNPPLINIGLRASHIIRSIPPQILDKIIEILLSKGLFVSLVGGPEDKDIGKMLISAKDSRVFHMYQHCNDFRDSIAHISLSDGMIGPDSSCLHIAAAFEKKIIGAYGAFLSELRVKHYKTTSAFDIKMACSPCFLHGIETCEYSDIVTKEPLCMNQHIPEVIVEELICLLEATGAQWQPSLLPTVPNALQQL